MPGFSDVTLYQGQVAATAQAPQNEGDRHESGQNTLAGGLGQVALPLCASVSSLDDEGRSGINLDNMRIVTVLPFVLLFGFSEVINIKHLGDCLAHSLHLADISSGGGNEEPLNMLAPRGPGESVCGKHWSLPAHVRAQRMFTRFIIFIIPSSYPRPSISYLQLQN